MLIVKQIGLGSLWNLDDCVVSWLEMHFCKKNQHVWEKMPIEGAIHLRSHNIPLTLRMSISQINKTIPNMFVLECISHGDSKHSNEVQ